MKTIGKLNSGDSIKIDLFGKEKTVEIFSKMYYNNQDVQPI